MKKTTSKPRMVPSSRPRKEACPVCGVLYTIGVGLAAHIRFKHANASQGQPVAGKGAIKTKAAILEPAAIDPQTYLQTALDQLITRKSEIDHQLGKASMLREEGERIGKRIEVVQVALKAFNSEALKAFNQESMAASG